MTAKNKTVLNQTASVAFLIVLFALVILTEPPTACAVSEHAEHGAVSFGQFLGSILIFWINFLIYVALLFFILRKPFKDVWQQRRETYAQNIAEARSKLERSKERLLDAQVRVSTVHTDKERLREEVQKETHDECQQIIAQAKERSKSIIKAAHELARAERLAAEREVQAEIAEQALTLAREELGREMTPQADKPYRQKALQAVKQLLG